MKSKSDAKAVAVGIFILVYLVLSYILYRLNIYGGFFWTALFAFLAGRAYYLSQTEK